MVDVLAEHLQRGRGSLAVRGPVVGSLHRGDGHVGELVGHGIDYAEQYRYLPYIGTID